MDYLYYQVGKFLDRAYTNNEILYYDGDGKLYIAVTSSLKVLLVDDLTIPSRLIRNAERYKRAPQLVTDNTDNTKTIISHSLGAVIGHHILVDNEQLDGRLYSTPSLAIPHDSITYVPHSGDPIAMFNLDSTHRKFYLGNPHAYTG